MRINTAAVGKFPFLILAILAGLVGLDDLVSTTGEKRQDQDVCPAVLSPAAQLANGPMGISENVALVDDFTLRSDRDLYRGYAPRNDDGTVNVVVEIPSGTNAKWEVVSDGQMIWEMREGSPRIVNFLPYPGNYGMVPNTVIPKDQGGDGDGLDVIVLGPALPRGTVARVHLIGVMKFLDKGEQDDKFLAVMDNTPLGSVRSLKELDDQFPGASEIVLQWFCAYKGPGGKMEFQGWGDVAVATKILESGMNTADHGTNLP